MDIAPVNGTSIVRLVGVYDADGTVRGELTYWIGARLGRAHCGLCDITHGRFREREDWRRCRNDLPVIVDTYHRDDQPHAVRVASHDSAPVVVAETDAGHVVLLTKEEIEACGLSPEQLVSAIDAAVERLGLVWRDERAATS